MIAYILLIGTYQLLNSSILNDIYVMKMMIQTTTQTQTCTHTHTHTHTYIYIYISKYIYVVPSISFQTFCRGIQNCRRLLNIQYVIAIHLMTWLTNFYDFSFKRTATAIIGIHSTKAWLWQLVNFKNTIWTWGRTICNQILF